MASEELLACANDPEGGRDTFSPQTPRALPACTSCPPRSDFLSVIKPEHPSAKQLRAACVLMLAMMPLQVNAAPPVERIAVDFTREAGRIKAIHGVNGGPVSNGENPDLSGWFTEAGFPTARLHDCHWPCPDVVDISTVFPLSHLDPDDPRNYTFARTDAYIAGVLKTGTKIVYRLGESIEIKGTRYHINPPEDMDRFARVCVNVIRHCNEGWANGSRHGIEYWEVWNEPENRMMWTGTQEEYFTLYEKVAKAIKACDPRLKVGGPAFTSGAFGPKGWARPFLERCRDRKLPLDFFSFHGYTVDAIKLCRNARKLLDDFGFGRTEAHFNEWRYTKTWQGLRPKDPEAYAGVPAWFERGTDGNAAAYAISVLIRLQDERIDMANYYTADTSAWSMFGQFGVRRPVYFAFVGFNELAKRPRRVGCTVQADAKANPSAALASVAEDGRSAAVLISTFMAPAGSRAISFAGLPWTGETRVETLLVDDKHSLEKTPATVDGDGNVTKGVAVDLPTNAVCLIRLTRVAGTGDSASQK